MRKFRKLSTPLMIMQVASRFIFGLGVGTTMARYVKRHSKTIGWAAIALGTAMAIPGAVVILKERMD